MKKCKICHSKTAEIDSTGRCSCCAAVLRASRLKLSYGQYMAVKRDSEPEKAREPEEEIYSDPLVTMTKRYVKVCQVCGRKYWCCKSSGKYCSGECREASYEAKRVAAIEKKKEVRDGQK